MIGRGGALEGGFAAGSADAEQSFTARVMDRLHKGAAGRGVQFIIGAIDRAVGLGLKAEVDDMSDGGKVRSWKPASRWIHIGGSSR